MTAFIRQAITCSVPNPPRRCAPRSSKTRRRGWPVHPRLESPGLSPPPTTPTTQTGFGKAGSCRLPTAIPGSWPVPLNITRCFSQEMSIEAMNAQRAIWRRLQVQRRHSARSVSARTIQRRPVSRFAPPQDGRRCFSETHVRLLRGPYHQRLSPRNLSSTRPGLTPVSAHLDAIDPPDGPACLASDIWRRLPSTVIVYGTCAMRAPTATPPNNSSSAS